MNKLIWKSEEEQLKELNERINNWEEGKSKDGYILCAEGCFIYKRIKYLVKVLRYYNHTNKFTSIHRERISDKHCVIEYPNETKPIVNLVSSVEGVYDFLYHDTLHSFNDKQTIEEQIKLCHKLAKDDINNLLSGEIEKKIDESIKRLQNIKRKLKEEIKNDK